VFAAAQNCRNPMLMFSVDLKYIGFYELCLLGIILTLFAVVSLLSLLFLAVIFGA